MTLRVTRRPRRPGARARAKAAPEATAMATETTAADAQPVAADAEAAPEPPRRVHMFGSQYTVKMSFEELMRTRGYLGEQVLLRRSLAESGSAPQRQRHRAREAAARRAGHAPGTVLWPSE
ncbi:hypothetical protein A5773_20090 [Mycobacterium sp. 852014-52450_SCH5900713]|uniref:hypothetical protein n=1 Tax=Mycobacterium sp. 852014-52450_SCH5900713 TaxID=1834116 RepID=UPI0007FC9FE5|nr:hypothetical protein [Mycobacterium sp. 852014-52450_SCH5900713]OBF93050.1 hypothetical protein A5773_20090 [Mycobacterium sp. 852014-52450_SCH5900713]